MHRQLPGNTPGDRNAEVEKLLHALQKLRNDFVAIQTAVNEDIVYRRESELLMEALKEQQDFDLTHAFKVNIIDKFAAACGEYSRIKTALPPYITEHEIRAIEDGFTSAASRQSAEAAKFFPTMQKIHVQGYNDYKNEYLPLMAPNRQKADAIHARYNSRSVKYKEWHCGAALFIIALGVGLPFFIGGLIVHAVDKMITSLRIHMINKQNKEISEKIDTNYNPELPRIMQRIKEDKFIGLKQGFFQTAKARHAKPCSDFENLALNRKTAS